MCNETRTYGPRLGLFLLSAFLLVLSLSATPILEAQIHGVPASVTSLDNNNHTLANPPGVPASVTSLGPQGFTPGSGCCFNFPAGNNRRFFNGRHHRDHNSGFVGGAGVPYPVYVPYYDAVDTSNSVDEGQDSNAAVGPTIFDRNGNNRASASNNSRLDERLDRLEQKLDEAASNGERAESSSIAPPRTAPDQPATVLVFRDGHSIEVKNYAIVGDTLYDYSTGRSRKFALGDLDLAATQKQNDERGVDFRVPGHPSGS
jgi:hypothetical protein